MSGAFHNRFAPAAATPTRDVSYGGLRLRCAACAKQLPPLFPDASDPTPIPSALAGIGAVIVTSDAGARQTACGEPCAEALRAAVAKQPSAPVGRDASAFVWSAPSTVAGQAHLSRVKGTCHGCLGSSFDTMLPRSEADAVVRYLIGQSWRRVNRGDGAVSWACSIDCRAKILSAANPYEVSGDESCRRFIESGAETSEMRFTAMQRDMNPDVSMRCTSCTKAHSLPASVARAGFAALGWQDDPSGTGSVCSTTCLENRRLALGQPIRPGAAAPPGAVTRSPAAGPIDDVSYQRRRQELAASAAAASTSGLRAQGVPDRPRAAAMPSKAGK